MDTAGPPTAPSPRERGPGPRWTAVVLPAEHGSWSLVLEPVALGLAVAPSAAALLVAVATAAGFLAYRPSKLWRGDRQRGRFYRRTLLARRFAWCLGGTAAVALLGAGVLGGPHSLSPFALATPLGALYLWYDRRPGRSWQAETTAPAAISAAAATAAMASGWQLAPALALWGLAAARSLPAVLHVRERLRLERQGEARRGLAWGSHAVGLAAVAGLAAARLVPVAAIWPYGVLLARAVAGLGPLRREVAPKAIGIAEIFWGVLTVAGVAAAYRW